MDFLAVDMRRYLAARWRGVRLPAAPQGHAPSAARPARTEGDWSGPARGGGVLPRALGPIGAYVGAPASFPWAAAYSVIGGGPFWVHRKSEKNEIYSKHRNVGLLADTVCKMYGPPPVCKLVR